MSKGHRPRQSRNPSRGRTRQHGAARLGLAWFGIASRQSLPQTHRLAGGMVSARRHRHSCEQLWQCRPPRTLTSGKTHTVSVKDLLDMGCGGLDAKKVRPPPSPRNLRGAGWADSLAGEKTGQGGTLPRGGASSLPRARSSRKGRLRALCAAPGGVRMQGGAGIVSAALSR
jgi:hypothetical protein